MAVDLCDEATKQWVLQRVPQQPPFRFIDRIVEMSTEHIISEYRFKQDEYYYKGHFPDDPMTPGVIMLECMAQAGLVALGVYIVSLERPGVTLRSLFSDCAIDFLDVVKPGTLVTVKGQKVFWRRNKLKCQVEMRREDGVLVAHGTVSGMGVEIP